MESGLDAWLAELGYVREGDYYRVKQDNPDTVVMASHAGASSAALSDLLNLSFPFVYKAIQPKYTAITVITFKGAVDELIFPHGGNHERCEAPYRYRDQKCFWQLIRHNTSAFRMCFSCVLMLCVL